MDERPIVFLMPAEYDWAFVIVERPTGVVYQNQYGGNACMQGKVEGYLVPVDATEQHAVFEDIFVRRLDGGGTGANARALDEDMFSELRAAVATIQFWPSNGSIEWLGYLSVDDGRRTEIDEAWVPVITPDGKGVLVWSNSD